MYVGVVILVAVQSGCIVVLCMFLYIEIQYSNSC